MESKDLNNARASIKARAASAIKFNSMKKLIVLLMNSIAILVAIVYLVSVMYTRFGGFTVSVNKYQNLKYGLSLSETKDFSKPTSMLNCKATELITNIDGKTLDNIDFGAVDGNNSGNNYLCYNFYLKNVGTESVSFEYSIIITNMTLGIEKAVRVRLITKYNNEDQVIRDYARAAGVDDVGNVIPEENTIPFYTKNIIMEDSVENSTSNDIMKFTVVIWLEGNDLECVDDILGGEFQIDMKFSVTGTGASGDE